jgi:hypothetical protein
MVLFGDTLVACDGGAVYPVPGAIDWTARNNMGDDDIFRATRSQ